MAKRKEPGPDIIRPRLMERLEASPAEPIHIEDEASFRNTYISDCRPENETASHVSFEGMVFKNVDFRDMILHGLEVTDTRFENCDLSNADLSGAVIHRAEFDDCKLTGLNLSDATLGNVRMNRCNGRFALVRFARMKQVILEESQFEGSNFQNSSFSKVQFKRCILRLSQMAGTNLSGMDLSDSDVEGLGVRPEDLNGAIVSPMQAVDFSKLLGLVIKS